MTLVLSLLIAALLGYILLQTLTFDKERKQWASERRELNGRIQAPEQAARLFSEKTDKPKARVLALNDDAAFLESLDTGANGNG